MGKRNKKKIRYHELDSDDIYLEASDPEPAPETPDRVQPAEKARSCPYREGQVVLHKACIGTIVQISGDVCTVLDIQGHLYRVPHYAVYPAE